MRHTLTTIAIVALSAAAWTGAAHATPQQTPPPPEPQQQQPDVEVDDAELETFADIYVDVQARRTTAQEEMAATESTEEQQSLRETAERELVTIIEDHGWTVEKYNMVANVINSDIELRQKAIELINERS